MAETLETAAGATLMVAMFGGFGWLAARLFVRLLLRERGPEDPRVRRLASGFVRLPACLLVGFLTLCPYGILDHGMQPLGALVACFSSVFGAGLSWSREVRRAAARRPSP